MHLPRVELGKKNSRKEGNSSHRVLHFWDDILFTDTSILVHFTAAPFSLKWEMYVSLFIQIKSSGLRDLKCMNAK